MVGGDSQVPQFAIRKADKGLVKIGTTEILDSEKYSKIEKA